MVPTVRKARRLVAQLQPRLLYIWVPNKGNAANVFTISGSHPRPVLRMEAYLRKNTVQNHYRRGQTPRTGDIQRPTGGTISMKPSVSTLMGITVKLNSQGM